MLVLHCQRNWRINSWRNSWINWKCESVLHDQSFAHNKLGTFAPPMCCQLYPLNLSGWQCYDNAILLFKLPHLSISKQINTII
jgi:hypothetical protein